MRFLFASVLGLGLISTPQVLCITTKECWPNADCLTYTPAFSGSGVTAAIDEKTPWSGQLAIDKFNSHGTRTLIGVQINTILYFNTTLFFNRTNPASGTGGTATAGFMLNMDLHDNPGLLGQYWGRWGDYLELVNDVNNVPSFTDQGQIGIDVTGLDSSQFSAATTPLFVNYTYPLFDVDGFTPNQNFLDRSGPVWEYYLPSSVTENNGWPQVFYGTKSQGIIINEIDDGNQPQPDGSPIALYYTKQLDSGDETPFTVDDTWPLFQEKQIGTTQIYDRFNEAQSFSKSIKSSDLDGGLNRDMSPQTMLNLFDTASGGSSQVLFDVGATGQYVATFTGGNAGLRQETYAKVAVRVEYTFTCTTCGDPQFGGFQGQSFQVHGYPGSYFNLFSAPSFQMNGRFTYLASGHCNYDHTPCWTHPGTYIDDVTFVVDELLIRVTAGAVGAGYSVLINNEPFHAHRHANESDIAHTDSRQFVPTKFYDPNTRTTVFMKSPLEVIVRTELVSFALHNADHFFNVDSQLLVRPLMNIGRKPSSEYADPVTGKPGFPDYPIHGFIGQTWANKKYTNKRQYQGEPDDYIEPRPYATESLYSQYHKQFDEQTVAKWTQN